MAEYTSSLLTNSKGVPLDQPVGEKLADRNEIGSSAANSEAGGKYKISNLMYPSNLLDDENAGSYVMFYLNVNVDSKLLKQPENYTVDDVPTRNRGLLVNEASAAKNNNTSSFVPSLLTGGGIGAGVGAAFNLGAKATAAAGAAASVGAGKVAASQTTTLSRAQKRLAAAIALYVPNQLKARYSANWETEDTQLFSALKEGGEALINMVQDGNYKEVLNQTTANDSKFSNIAGGIFAKTAPEALNGLIGIAQNPRKEMFFKTVDFRTFVFEYRFSPRNEKEAENVQNIIYMFKLHMHPEYQKAGEFFFLYPSEFDIQYFHNHKENVNVHRHTSCVLTDMYVDYAPNGQHVTFSNGMSSQIDITLTFRELSVLTKEDIQKGL